MVARREDSEVLNAWEIAMEGERRDVPENKPMYTRGYTIENA